MKLLLLLLLFTAVHASENQSLFQKIRRRLQQTIDADGDDGSCDYTYGEFIACAVENMVSCVGSCSLTNPGLVPGQECDLFNTFYTDNKGCCVDDVCDAALEDFNECMSCSAIPEPTQVLTISPTISPPTDPPTILPTSALLTGTPTRTPTRSPLFTNLPTAAPTKKETPMPQVELMSMSMSMDIETPSPTVTETLPPIPSPTTAPTQNQCLIPGCCVEDCCGPGTSWDSNIKYCIEDSSSLGWNGTYETDYERGCFERTCCESDCCGSGSVYDADIKCCVPVA